MSLFIQQPSDKFFCAAHSIWLRSSQLTSDTLPFCVFTLTHSWFLSLFVFFAASWCPSTLSQTGLIQRSTCLLLILVQLPYNSLHLLLCHPGLLLHMQCHLHTCHSSTLHTHHATCANTHHNPCIWWSVPLLQLTLHLQTLGICKLQCYVGMFSPRIVSTRFSGSSKQHFLVSLGSTVIACPQKVLAYTSWLLDRESAGPLTFLLTWIALPCKWNKNTFSFNS